MKLAQSGRRFIKPAASLTGAATFAITALNVASAKTPTPTYTGKASILISRMFGPNIAAAIFASQFGNNPASYPPQGITPFGVINSSTGGGIVLLIINEIIGKFGVPYYSYFRPFLKSIGAGLIGGGVIGGLFDPETGLHPGTPAPSPSIRISPAAGIAASTAAAYVSSSNVRLHGQ